MYDHTDNGAVDGFSRPRSRSEAKRATPSSMKSRVHTIFGSVFDKSTKVAKLIQPVLEGTPFKAPIDIFLAIVEVIDVRADTTCVVDV